MNDTTPSMQTCRRFATQGWIGLLLIAVFWPLNWLLPGLRTHVLFFPLWLGYALAVDGLVFLRKGTSLLTRSRARFVGLFLVSAPAWWLFEGLNSRAQNWHYVGRELFTAPGYFVLASFSFRPSSRPCSNSGTRVNLPPSHECPVIDPTRARWPHSFSQAG